MLQTANSESQQREQKPAAREPKMPTTTSPLGLGEAREGIEAATTGHHLVRENQ